jgi:hypothetical protein
VKRISKRIDVEITRVKRRVIQDRTRIGLDLPGK